MGMLDLKPLRAYTVEITDACREKHGNAGSALAAAILKLSPRFHEYAEAWPVGKGMTFRIVLEMTNPRESR